MAETLKQEKSIVLPVPNGASIHVEYEKQLDGRMIVTNWPSILESASSISKEEMEEAEKEYPYSTLPNYIFSVLIVLKGGYNKITNILPLDSISDTNLQNELLQILTPALDTLSDRDRDVFEHFYGIGCPRTTLSAIGARLGFTEERVRQIKEKALRRVRVFTARSVEGQ